MDDNQEQRSQNGKASKKSKAVSDEDESEALGLMTTQEELPQVAGVVDDSRLRYTNPKIIRHLD